MSGHVRRAALAFAALSAACVVPRPGSAQTTDEADIRAQLDAAAKAFTPGHGFMGSVLVAVGERRLLDKGYGMANVQTSLASAPQVKYRIGSLTKQFTAAAILLLQQDGRLCVNDPVGRYMPDTPPAWSSIALAELLGHTSGIPDLTRDPDFPAWSQTPRNWPELLARFRDKPLDFKPGARFEYSSSNYELLGAIIEKVSGQGYGDFLRRRIFEPLGMGDTGLDRDGLVVSKRAQGYRIQPPGALTPAPPSSLTVAWSAGALYSTSEDLLRWERGLFGGQLLSVASLRQMTTPGLGGYGMGVFVVTDPATGLKVVAHGGAIEGFHSFLIYAPERRVTVAVLSNVEGFAPDKLAQDLLAIAAGRHDVLPAISAKQLDRFVGDYNLPSAGFSLTFRRTGDTLDSISNGDVLPTVYEGRIGGVPAFYVPRIGAEITFNVDASGAVNSLVLHQNGHDIPGARR
jgi:CubicO group peptidase (beta-lactamase class C family)